MKAIQWAIASATPAALLLAATALATPAEAGIRDGSVEFGAYVFHSNFDNESNIEDDEGFGGRVGFYFSDHHGLELGLEFLPTHDDLGLGLDVDLTTLRAGYVYNFTPGGVVSPYLSAGGGLQRVQVSQDTVFGNQELEDETDPAAYGAFGARFFIGPVFNLRAEAQVIAVFPDSDPDETLVDGALSAGFGWVIGGH